MLSIGPSSHPRKPPPLRWPLGLILLLGLFLVGLLALQSLGPTAPATPPLPPIPTIPMEASIRPSPTQAQGPLIEFSAERAYQHIQYLATTIGPRATGSLNTDRAAAYIVAEFQSYGYRPERREFEYVSPQSGKSSLIIRTPEKRDIEVIAILGSASGDIAADLEDGGLGRQGDFNPGALKGKITLVERGQIPFSEKLANVIAAGAIGAIIFNNQPGDFRGRLPDKAAIPVVSIAREDGLRLRDMLKRGPVEVELRVEAPIAVGRGTNVVTTKIGVRRGTVIIGAHYDSVPEAPGANDNGSGIATMLELSWVLASKSYPYTIHFVAFDAEEIGLLGSEDFAGRLTAEEREEILAMISVDALGLGDKLELTGSPELVELAAKIAGRMGTTFGTEGLEGATSDHASFIKAGMPALHIGRIPDSNLHTSNDRPEFVEPAHLDTAGRLTLMLLEELVSAPTKSSQLKPKAVFGP